MRALTRSDSPDSRIAAFLTAINRSWARVIPLSVLNGTARPVADAVRIAWKSKRENARANYAMVLGRSPDDPEVDRVVRNCFRHFGCYVAETLHVQGWGTEDVEDRVSINGQHHLDEAAAAGRGVIFVSAHIGSPEVGATLAVLNGFRVTAVTEQVKPDWLMEYIVASRRRMGITLLPSSGAGISLIRQLLRGGMVAFIVDAGIDRPGSVPVTLFGRQALFPEGPARLSRLTGAPIVFAVAARQPHGRFAIHVCPPMLRDSAVEAETDVLEKTQQLATYFEEFVRRYPGQWYAFRQMWLPGGNASP